MPLWLAATIAEDAATEEVPSMVVVIIAFCAILMILGLCARDSSISIETNKVTNRESDGDESPSSGSANCKSQKTAASRLQSSGSKLLSLIKSRSTHNDRKLSNSCDQLRELEEAYSNQGQEEACWSGPLWRRTILMGEKCEPPEFSGLILYDNNGNRIPEFPAKLSKAASNPEMMQVTVVNSFPSSS
ncbi:hypothetical protein O6H91_17G054300 [Diphasiastrum complanatum]|uniref:Uncharacterized protein n=1 Tax=Diphasiastrum complanatum TaxID=34168 RepID=A0ACC2B6X2_DIPCM|nr:hypothetical protein O6H91_17G054300 [Diphasiastrum complanatum]